MAERLPEPDNPEILDDRGDATPPHGDELHSERSFGRTDRYTNADDPDPDRPTPSEHVRGQDDEGDDEE
jgi:hypothetical protein